MNSVRDAFAMFGDEDEDEDEHVDDKVGRLERVVLLDHSTKQRRLSVDDQNAAVDITNQNSETKSAVYAENLDQSKQLNLPWKNPLYLGPVTLIQSLVSYGGGRGYIATKYSPPGTLVLAEEPLVPWNDQEGVDFSLKIVRLVLETDDAKAIIIAMEHFYPTKAAVDAATFEDDDGQTQVHDMIERLQDKYQDDGQLMDCVELARENALTNADGTPLNETDCLRILLAIQYNSLESGIYLHAAMLNHADQPNCVKFAPSNGKTYSEVRTTRHVCAGEPLTISYLPRILSHASRRKHLFDQHRFDIGAVPGVKLRNMELIGGDLPISTIHKWDNNSITHRIEVATAELREICQDAEHGVMDAEHVKGLEQATLELCRQAEEQLRNRQHLLLIPCLELHLDCCDLAQRVESLSKGQRLLLLARVVKTAQQLISLQSLFHGPDHFDLAKSSLDLAQAIEELLSRSPKQLIAINVDGIDTISAWSSLAHKWRKEHNRIKALYPHDADTWIATCCGPLTVGT